MKMQVKIVLKGKSYYIQKKSIVTYNIRKLKEINFTLKQKKT